MAPDDGHSYGAAAARLRACADGDAAKGIVSTEHINALAEGTAGATAFNAYSAESRSRGTTWTVIAEGAVLESERRWRVLGDATSITHQNLWTRAGEDLSQKLTRRPGRRCCWRCVTAL